MLFLYSPIISAQDICSDLDDILNLSISNYDPIKGRLLKHEERLFSNKKDKHIEEWFEPTAKVLAANACIIKQETRIVDYKSLFADTFYKNEFLCWWIKKRAEVIHSQWENIRVRVKKCLGLPISLDNEFGEIDIKNNEYEDHFSKVVGGGKIRFSGTIDGGNYLSGKLTEFYQDLPKKAPHILIHIRFKERGG